MKNFALVAVVLASIPGSSFAAHKPSKESLVKAWEAVLKADPDTRVFEKIEEGRYKFKTEAFPYDGELKVLNVVISTGYDESFSGRMEIDLPALTQELQNKLSNSYRGWDERSNGLFFSDDDSTWLTWKERSRKAEAKRKNSLMARFGDTVPYILAVMFVGLLGLVVWTVREAVRQTKEIAMMRESLSSTNEKLARIVDLLGSRNETGEK